MTDRTPRELFADSLRHLLAKDMAAYVGLWAADGVMEFPFAPPGYPARLDGRAALDDYLRGYPDLFDVREIPAQTVHETSDPEVVVGEFEAAGLVVATGLPYRMRYVAVITARGGEIVHYRDYWSPVAAAEAMGGLDALMAGFAGSAS